MSDPIQCPGCGQRNPPGSEHCQACNFPLTSRPLTPVAPHAEPAAGGEITIPRPPRRRPHRPPPTNQALSLWLLFGAIAAATVIYVALKANVERATPPIEGASTEQRQSADQFRAALAKDSSSVDAHIGLANVLYDTGNWSEAVVHYRAAIRRDSSHVHALVDLGVCYYNLGNPSEAERLFSLALVRDPHQPVALFNLGIVNEARANHAAAMSYFHRALESAPPEDMKQAILAAMKRIQEAAGTAAPPLDGGR